MENNTDRGDLIHRTMGLTMHNLRLHHRLAEKRIESVCEGIHHSQHRTLMMLSGMGRAASQKDLAEMMNVTPACVARALKSLSQAGLIDRIEAEQDGRCNEVRITEKGVQMVNDSRMIFQKMDSEMYADFSDEEIQQLNQLMQRLNRNLSRMDSGNADSE